MFILHIPKRVQAGPYSCFSSETVNDIPKEIFEVADWVFQLDESHCQFVKNDSGISQLSETEIINYLMGAGSFE